MKPWCVAFASLLFTLAPMSSANTLLTNDVAVGFVLPAVSTPTLLHGSFGYAIYVPPGATRLSVVFDPDDLFYVSELVLRHEFDTGYTGTSTILADFRTGTGMGTRELVVTPQSSPPLQTGTYFIGFNIVSLGAQTHATLRATVEGGSVPPVLTVALSNFDTGLDGWTTNSAPSNVPGASQGDANSSLTRIETGGNPRGYLRYDEAGGPLPDALVAPAKFLGNLAVLDEPRLEFDLKILSSSGAAFPVEIRLFGAGSAFSWTGSQAPLPPDDVEYPLPPGYPPGGPPQNPPPTPGDSRWRHFTAALQAPLWMRLTGETTWAQMLANVERIEIITDLSTASESIGLDNIALRARGEGPPPQVLPGNTSFSAGPDGWARNYPASSLAGASTGNADSTFRWAAFEGNPSGYIRLNSSGGANRDCVLAPSTLLGDYSGISNPRFEFDYLHVSGGTATRPIQIRLLAAGSVFVWTGPVPSDTWTHYVAPLGADLWVRESGDASFLQALNNVQRLEISMQQQEAGPETNAIDNFWLLPGEALAPAPPVLSANPLALSFTAVTRGSNPAPQPLNLTSIGGGLPVSFNLSASSQENWLRLAGTSGTTPRSLNVWADISNLGPGAYTGRVLVTPIGPGMEPQTVLVTLAVSERPGPVPRIHAEGIVNAASNRRQLAAGALGTLYGTGLGPATGVVAAFAPGGNILPTRLQGIRVLVQETYGALIAEAPLLYAGENQINFQLPFEAFGRSEVRLVVDNNGNLSEPVAVQVIPSAPGIFTWAENRAVAVNQDNTVNTSSNAANRGATLTVYMTGQGVVTPSLLTGAAAPARPLVRSPLPAQAWIGGVPAQILFLGLTPGLVGVLQLNLVVPTGAPLGDSPLVVNLNGWSSNEAVVSVRSLF